MGDLVNNIDIEERIYDPFMDLYIIFGRNVAKRAKPFCVAWQFREEDKLTQPKSFKHAPKARAHFNAAVTGEIEPDICDRDPHAQNVYDWENTHLNDFLQPLSKKQARAIVKRIAKDYQFKTPKINFNSDDGNNYYDPDSNEIHLTDIDNIALLHELSHALVEHLSEDMERSYINHCPQFVWSVIDLYRKYVGIDLQYLTTTAVQYNILGDIEEKQIWDLDNQP